MDTLAAIVTLLKPQPCGTKLIHGRGRWGVRYPAFGQPAFALVLTGRCLLEIDGATSPLRLDAGDFVLFPAMPGFAMKSDARARTRLTAPSPSGQFVDEIVHGGPGGKPSVTMLGGYFAFDPVNASLLLGLLPGMLRLRASDPSSASVAAIVGLIQREAAGDQPGRSLILTRLLEILLVETLRAAPTDQHPAGLLAGLRDPQIAAALRAIHTQPARPWTLPTLAREARMSRSSFAARFSRLVGLPPLGYLLQWRLGLARHMLAHEDKTVAETALAIGYESASGFSTAFRRETGRSPRDFAHSLHLAPGKSTRRHAAPLQPDAKNKIPQPRTPRQRNIAQDDQGTKEAN